MPVSSRSAKFIVLCQSSQMLQQISVIVLSRANGVQFQLTINLVALVVAFVAAVTTGEMPLNVLQLLWGNLIMDALAALGTYCWTCFSW